MNLENLNKILVIMLGGIGNLILMRPALRALRQGLPGREITILTSEPHVEEIIAAEQLFDEVILFDRREKQPLKSKIDFILQMRKKQFDLALVASGTNAFKASVSTFLMGIEHRVGENINGMGFLYTKKVAYEKGRTHEMDGVLALIEAMGLDIKDEYPSLTLYPEDIQKVNHFLKEVDTNYNDDVKLIGIHTGSGYLQKYKRWPKERFAQLADRIAEKFHFQIVLTGGTEEIGLVEQISELMHRDPIQAAGKLSIRETAALIKRCRLFISNDSGLAHISAAVDTPLIVLFGKTNENRIAPRGNNVVLLKSQVHDQNPLEAISVEEVFEKACEQISTGETGHDS